MKPLLSPTEGGVIRAVVLYLSENCDKRAVIVESIESCPWSSLTFTGERHRLVIRLPGGVAPVIDGNDLIVPGSIVALAQAAWTTVADGTVGVIDLLTIATSEHV